MRRLVLVVAGLTAALIGASQSLADPIQWSDDFSSDTTGNYDTYYFPFTAGGGPSQGGQSNISYDAANQRLILTTTGGYGWGIVTPRGVSAIDPGVNFTLSCDTTVLSEYNGALYLGNLAPTDTETTLRFRFDNFLGDKLTVEIRKDGQGIANFNLPYGNNGNNLTLARVGSEYDFYCNGLEVWHQTIPELDGLPLYFGVANVISSGPSGLTAQTAFDNLSFTSTSTSTPEPSTVVLLGVGVVSLLGYVWRRRRRAG